MSDITATASYTEEDDGAESAALLVSASIAERILEDILSALAAINGASGYATRLKTLSRGLLSPLETTYLPTASLLPVSDEPEYGAQTLRRSMAVTVRVWIDTALATAPMALEALIADVKKALRVASRRSGYAQDSREVSTNYIYLQSAESLAGADVNWTIDYRTDIDNPLQQS
jgi:hypothetical protein